MSTTAPATAAPALPTLVSVPLGSLFPSPLNPRKRFTPESLADLTANIQKRGEVVQPLLLRTKGKQFEIVDGERRYHSSKAAANITAVPGIIRDDLTDSDVIEFMLLTSIQKQELTPLEEAGGFKALIDSNKAKYSALYIADRIGRSEKYVWDRMKLLDLIPILKKLLDAERILVGHAELLCKLKPEDQERAVEWDSNRSYAAGRSVSGLWQSESDNLRLDDDHDGPSAKNLYRGLKPVTVKELESWIAHHVRFDVAHMAKSAPLEFGQVAKDVEHAAALPGRGKKVIAITHEYRVADDARDPSERTYGSNSWERADGKEKSKTCEYSVLGTVVAGRGYGSTLQVCVNRDKCAVHFGKVIKERERNQKLRQQGKGGQAAQNEVTSNAKRAAKEEAERAERERKRQSWKAMSGPLFGEAFRQAAAVKALTPKQAKALLSEDEFYNLDLVKQHLGADWFKKPAAALLAWGIAQSDDFRTESYEEFASRVIVAYGLDVKPFEAIRDKHTPKVEAAAPAQATKKAKKR